MTCLAVGIAVARGHIGRDYCLGERYSTLSAPLVVALYLAVVCYSQRSCRPATGGIVFLAIVGILISYQRTALRYAPELSLLVRRLEFTVHEGMPPAVVAGRCAVDSKCDVPLLAHYLELLRNASIGPYRCPALPQGQSPHLTHCVGRNSDLLAKGRLELASDQWRSQAIPLAAGRLCGIDVRLRETMREAPPQAVEWQLVAIDSKGGRSVLHNGSAEIIPSQDPLFARLRFEPVSVPLGGALELELRRQGSALVRLPLYQFLDDPSRSSLQLFTFFTD
jgi:hypothetical protein